jgi:hypothetical protein
VETVAVTGMGVPVFVTTTVSPVERTTLVGSVTVDVTVLVVKGAGAVLVLGVKPMQSHAEEYWKISTQAEAYSGISKSSCRGS